jgi:hypothetical protein
MAHRNMCGAAFPSWDLLQTLTCRHWSMKPLIAAMGWSAASLICLLAGLCRLRTWPTGAGFDPDRDRRDPAGALVVGEREAAAAPLFGSTR